ncbi:MAG: type II toxin-antitoxin system VapC family toxin [Tepidisphaeraceae bacterium]|jgi:predicted nucleic acid-binding protein
MSSIVVDASIVLAWLFDEDRAAAKLKPLIEKSDLIAPWLWRLEVANAVLVRLRRKSITETQAARVLRVLDELEIDLIPEPADRTAASLTQIARPHQLSAYDAVYLDLAIRMGLPLFTRDENLRAAAKRTGVPLVTG